MIAVDTSAILAIALDEPEAETFKVAPRRDGVLIGWPTLFETRIVLAAKGFANAVEIVARLAAAPNVTAVPFDAKHYTAAETAYERFGKGRSAALKMGDCFAYAVAGVAGCPLLFKGAGFLETDVLRHPDAAVLGGGR